jgi:hypothetical protein
MTEAPVLTMACRRCARTASAPCPDLRDLPAATARLDGWGWDERGFVRCPGCMGAAEPAPDQGRLF